MFQQLQKTFEPSSDVIYQIALLHGIFGQPEMALEYLRSVESEDVRFERLGALLSALSFEDFEYTPSGSEYDGFFSLLQQYVQSSQLSFLPEHRKTSDQQFYEEVDKYKT